MIHSSTTQLGVSNMELKSKRLAGGKYEVTIDDVEYLVYQSDGLWWAKHTFTEKLVDSAPSKAQLLRSLEALHEVVA
jgi:hypothetical protein